MVPIYLHPELENWAKGQVSKGMASSVEALVIEAVVSRKAAGDWLDQSIASALESVEREGWVDGEAILDDIDRWIGELDQEIEELEEFRQKRNLA
jgi:hypothetical protein